MSLKEVVNPTRREPVGRRLGSSEDDRDVTDATGSDAGAGSRCWGRNGAASRGRLSWAALIKKSFGVDPLIDGQGNRMRWSDPAPLTDPATAVYRSGGRIGGRGFWRPAQLTARPSSGARFQITSTTPLFESATMNPGTRDGSHRHDPLTIGNEFLFFL